MRRLIQLFAILSVVAVLVVPTAFATPNSAPMGVVTGAQRAMVGQISAADGTNLYDGDTVATEATGAMRLRFGASQMVLTGGTVVTLNKSAAGVSATLVSGMVRFSSVPGSLLELHTLNVVEVRAKGDTAATGQLSIVAPTAFQVGSTKGELAVSVNGIEHDVTEPSAFRVDLDDANATPGGQGPRPAGKSGGIWIAVAAVAAGTTVAIILAFLSPSTP